MPPSLTYMMVCKLDLRREQLRIAWFLKSSMTSLESSEDLKFQMLQNRMNRLQYWWHANLLAIVLFKLHIVLHHAHFCFIHTLVVILGEGQKI